MFTHFSISKERAGAYKTLLARNRYSWCELELLWAFVYCQGAEDIQKEHAKTILLRNRDGY